MLIPALALLPLAGEPFDAAPFGASLHEGVGVVWEDPREVHRVQLTFRGPAPAANKVRLEYWGSRWPEQRVPKDRQPGGGSVGWWELGNWYNGGWRKADVDVKVDGHQMTFTFRPVNAKEFPEAEGYPAQFRYTLKLRAVGKGSLPVVERLQAFTDSVWEERTVTVAWRDAESTGMRVEALNAVVRGRDEVAPGVVRIRLLAASNSDPNTFDRPLLTVQRGRTTCTVDLGDLKRDPIVVPDLGVAVAEGPSAHSYTALLAAVSARGGRTLRSRVAEAPEQTWSAAWKGMPAKKRSIYFPMGLDGGRQRFLLQPDGAVEYRQNLSYIMARPGRDTERLRDDKDPLAISFEMPAEPAARTIEEGYLPICETSWVRDGVRYRQTALVTVLDGMVETLPPPEGDAPAVCMLQITFHADDGAAHKAGLPIRWRQGGHDVEATVDPDGVLRVDGRVRGQVIGDASVRDMAPGEVRTVVLKLPYVALAGENELAALRSLDFEREHASVAGWWRRRLASGMRLITPEPMLNDFHAAQLAHLLINCEREPGSDRRFARVGSFYYGAYSNESCMMVASLDRRGYHEEARQCLDAWIHYQGTVALPGDYSDHDGVLYGAGGYEAGGYNQHHGWVLWCLAEHYRYTRDDAWLRSAAPAMVAAAQWIVRQRARTAKRTDIARGLLPAGSLEDIGDWWPWLSTNCYTWRGLNSAAWALAQIGNPEAPALQREADAYRRDLLRAYRLAARRAPVVRLRDGIAVPHFPSHVYRRGRSFGWVCETLEGALHLLITGAIPPRGREAEWILDDYEDNLYLSNQYGYVLDDIGRYWFGRGGMSMQACLLLDVEPYLYRDDPKNALRAAFNAISVGYFPDVRMTTEHALPEMGDFKGDHFKTSDEANATGWLRQLFVREDGRDLWIGQAIPVDWLAPGMRCGVEKAETYYGETSVVYEAKARFVHVVLHGPRRNPPARILLRARGVGGGRSLRVTVNGKPWRGISGDTIRLPGAIGDADIVVWRP